MKKIVLPLIIMIIAVSCIFMSCQFDKSIGQSGTSLGTVDMDGDGTADGTAIDTDGDGTADGVDTDGDGIIDEAWSEAYTIIATDDSDANQETSSFAGKTLYFSGVVNNSAGYWKGNEWNDLGSNLSNSSDSIASGISIKDGDIYIGGDYNNSTLGYRCGGYWKNSTLNEVDSMNNYVNDNGNFPLKRPVTIYDIYAGANNILLSGYTMKKTNVTDQKEVPVAWLNGKPSDFNTPMNSPSAGYSELYMYCRDIDATSREVSFPDKTETLDYFFGCGNYPPVGRPLFFKFGFVDSSGTSTLLMDRAYFIDDRGEALDIFIYSITQSGGIVDNYEVYIGGLKNKSACIWKIVPDESSSTDITETCTILDTTSSESAVNTVIKTTTALYGGGYITTNNKKIAGYWYNSTWIALGDGTTDSIVKTLDVAGDDVLAGGYIVNSSGIKVAGYWNNGTWTALGDGTTDSSITDSSITD
ncbi:MAG: hypothetical protein PQJ46_09190 [Spirochaetales bacterium]|nr:hypothetical protein [Spirochaetales bacterium]